MFLNAFMVFLAIDVNIHPEFYSLDVKSLSTTVAAPPVCGPRCEKNIWAPTK